MFEIKVPKFGTACSLKGSDTFGRFFSPFLQGRQFLWLPVCFAAHQISSEKGSTLKGKNLLPGGANSFLFRVDPFKKGTKIILTELSPLKMYPSS